MNYIRTFDPCILLGDRLEITLYGMFVEAYINGKYDKEKMMYENFISYFPGEIGIHTPDNFIELIEKIKREEFNPIYPVYANPDNFTLLNGSHRCAIAIQLGIKKVYYNLRFKDDQVDEDFLQKVFGDKDYNLLLNKREEYISRCEPLVALKCRIRCIMRNHLKSFQAPFSSPTMISSLRLYQAFEKLEIQGKRPSEKRLKIYELTRYLNKSMSVLEVGSNVGFLSLTIADYVNSIDALDIDSNYIKIAEMVKEYCGINNCHFFNKPINEFYPEKQYDLVISTAVHGWSGVSFGQYISNLSQYIKPYGLILIESHEIDAENDWPAKKSMLLANFDLLESGFIDDVDETMYQSEMREFLIIKKKSGVDYTNLEFSGHIFAEKQRIDEKKSYRQLLRNYLSKITWLEKYIKHSRSFFK